MSKKIIPFTNKNEIIQLKALKLFLTEDFASKTQLSLTIPEEDLSFMSTFLKDQYNSTFTFSKRTMEAIITQTVRHAIYKRMLHTFPISLTLNLPYLDLAYLIKDLHKYESYLKLSLADQYYNSKQIDLFQKEREMTTRYLSLLLLPHTTMDVFFSLIDIHLLSIVDSMKLN